MMISNISIYSFVMTQRSCCIEPVPWQLIEITNTTMQLFHITQCTIQNRNVHISVLNGALWDMEQELRDKLPVTQVPYKAQDWASKCLATTDATTILVPYVYTKSLQLGRLSAQASVDFLTECDKLRYFMKWLCFKTERMNHIQLILLMTILWNTVGSRYITANNLSQYGIECRTIAPIPY